MAASLVDTWYFLYFGTVIFQKATGGKRKIHDISECRRLHKTTLNDDDLTSTTYSND